MKKIMSLFTLGLTAIVLTACGGQESKPANVVTSFMEAIQAGDFEKASTYVASSSDAEAFNFANIQEGKEDPATAALLKGISNNYKFSKPEEKMIDDNKAEVTVEVTSLDFATAMGTAMEEIFGIAFELAMEDQTEEEYNAVMEEKTTEILTSAMTDKEAEMVTRDVTLTLTKDDEGTFKIVSDAQLQEAILGNAQEVEEMLGDF